MLCFVVLLMKFTFADGEKECEFTTTLTAAAAAANSENKIDTKKENKYGN